MRDIRLKKYFILLFILITIYLFCLFIPFSNDHSVTSILHHPSSPYNCCTPQNIEMKKNIFFLKTHKTGSSTVQNIILRFGYRNQLNFLLPIYYTYYLPFSENLLPFGSQTPDSKYNILASHMRYTSQLNSHMHPGTITTTILRDPATLFQSLYSYFRMHTTVGMTFQEFLNTPEKPKKVWSLDNIVVYRGYNQMSFDLGLNSEDFENKTAINEFISKIDREFDFVMILEHFDASLILLSNLMGWPVEYVSYLKANARVPGADEYILTETDKLTLLKLNYADTMLYNHFTKKFHDCSKNYGVYNLNRKIRQLQTINQRLKDRCVEEENNSGILGSVNYVLKNDSDWDCVYSTKLQIPFTTEIAFKQIFRLLNQSNAENGSK